MNPEAKRPGQCWSRTGLRSQVPGQKHRLITDQSPGPAPSWPEPRFTHLKRKHEAFRGPRHCRALRERPSPMCVLVCPRWLCYADGRKTPLGRGSGNMKGGPRRRGLERPALCVLPHESRGRRCTLPHPPGHGRGRGAGRAAGPGRAALLRGCVTWAWPPGSGLGSHNP